MLIISIILVLGWVASDSVIKLARASTKDTTLAMLEQTKDIIDSRMMELNHMAVQISWDSNINSMQNINPPMRDADYYSARQAWLSVKNYHLTNTFIDTYYVYFQKTDVLISPDSSYTDIHFWYNHFFSYDNMAFDQWHTEIMSRHHYQTTLPARPAIIKGKPQQTLLYIQSIPIDSPSVFSGNVIILINEDEIINLLDRFLIGGTGYVRISDQNGQLITALNAPESEPGLIDGEPVQFKAGYVDHTINEDHFTQFNVISDYNGWQYTVAIPQGVLMENVENVKDIILNITIMSLLLGVAVSLFYAYRNYAPIREISNTINKIVDGDSRPGYGYDDISVGITKIAASNEYLKNELDKQRPFLVAAFFSNLFKGAFSSKEDIDILSQHNQVLLDSEVYVVILMRLDGFSNIYDADILKELNIRKVELKQLISQHMKNCYIHDIDNLQIGLLLYFDHQNEDECKQAIIQKIQLIKKDLTVSKFDSISIGVGSFYHELIDVYRSYGEAATALEYHHSSFIEETCWYSQIPRGSDEYYYPVESEQRLINLLKGGLSNKVSQMLNELYTENFENRALGFDMLKHMVYEVWHTLIKSLCQTSLAPDQISSLKSEIYQLDKSKPLTEIYANLSELYLKICDLINDRKKSHNSVLLDKIIAYIQANYTDHALCMSSLAERFGLSEVYLSQFIKEQAGVNFSTYLENIRMTCAQKLLITTKNSVTDIAQAVGYSSSTSFRRAYKRINGVSPTTLRNDSEFPERETPVRNESRML